MSKKVYEWIGRWLHRFARLFYSRVTGVCWNCGAHCEISFTMARGLMWCTHCFDRWQHTIRDQDFVFSWRYFGRHKNTL
jgi:hypothetical protein